jgi:hypothetical protein
MLYSDGIQDEQVSQEDQEGERWDQNKLQRRDRHHEPNGDLRELKVWYVPEGIANIFSVHELEKRYRIT